MGTFTVLLGIGSPDGQRFREVEALVDTGSTFTSVARSLLETLGHRPQGSERFELADGRIVERELTEVPIRIDGKTRTSICVFAEEESPALLGAVTLEQFLLAPDPVHQKLVPVTGLMMPGGRVQVT
jgi:predicted aspartyl protease